MVSIEYKYVHPIKSRGTLYYYYRRDGKHVRLPDNPATPEFATEYDRINRSWVSEGGIVERSLQALCIRFKESSEWAGLSDRSKSDYSRWMDWMCKEGGRDGKALGPLPVALMTAPDVVRFKDRLFNEQRPYMVNSVLRTLRRIMGYAIKIGWRTDNPVSKFGEIKLGAGSRPWPQAALEKAHDGLKDAMYLAFMLALYTGQRRGDVLKMTRHDYKDGCIHIKQEKTDEVLIIPVAEPLRIALKAAKKRGIYLVTRKDGKPYTKDGFSSVWLRAMKKLEIPYTFHGLRKTAASRLAELGVGDRDIMAITGHKTTEMVSLYTKGAKQKTRAVRAINRLDESVIRNGTKTESGKQSGKQ